VTSSMEAEQNGATSFDTAVKRKASYHYEGQTSRSLLHAGR